MHLFSTGNLRYSLAASLLMASVMGIVRFFFATPIPPDFLYSLLSRLLGIPFIFNLIHNLPFSLDRSAKYILYGLAVAAAAGGVVWLLLAEPDDTDAAAEAAQRMRGWPGENGTQTTGRGGPAR